MNAAAKNLKHYTIGDIYDLPDGQRAELIDGQIYLMAVPDRIHQDIVMDLSYLIKDYIMRKMAVVKCIRLRLRFFECQ